MSAPAAAVPGAVPLNARGINVRTAQSKESKSQAFDLYVPQNTQNNTSFVEVLNEKRHYNEVGSITYGVSQPRDAFVDARGNLYLANNGANVVEYGPHQWGSPKMTYSANVGNPAAVTVDRNQNVYEADSGNFAINEYDQGVNYNFSSCRGSSSDVPGGVAVDRSGDVFVSLVNSQGTIDIWEYQGGLANCTPTVLGISGQVPFFGDDQLAMDESGNLYLVAGAGVTVIDPPYDAVSETWNGYSCATNVKVDRAQTKLAYVTDLCAHTVSVVEAATGTLVTKLGTANGVEDPDAAVSSRNAVY